MDKSVPPVTQKYSLKLISRNNKKRIEEANEKLKELYPYELESNRLLIYRTDTKGIYDVYISKSAILGNNKIRNVVLLGLLSLFLLSFSVLILRYKITQRKTISALKKQQELAELEEINIQKEKEEYLNNLCKEFIDLQDNEYEKVFPRLEQIYSAIKDGCVIENLTIDKISFSIEITTKDAIAVFSAFESNPFFSNIKMNRTTIDNSKEIVSYSGMFSKSYIAPAENLMIEDKILFYENEISKIKDYQKKQQAMHLSEYIRHIRETLHSNGCKEQYIQIRNVEDFSEIEFFIQTSSRNIIQFIKQIQNENECLYYIKRIKIRNISEGKIQTTLCFDSRIKNTKEDVVFQDYKDSNISAEELDKIFYKAPVSKSVVKAYSEERKTADRKIVTDSKRIKTVTFLGISKINNRTMISVKDEVMGAIYSVCLLESEPADSSDFGMRTQNGYIARLRGEYYEVIK